MALIEPGDHQVLCSQSIKSCRNGNKHCPDYPLNGRSMIGVLHRHGEGRLSYGPSNPASKGDCPLSYSRRSHQDTAVPAVDEIIAPTAELLDGGRDVERSRKPHLESMLTFRRRPLLSHVRNLPRRLYVAPLPFSKSG